MKNLLKLSLVITLFLASTAIFAQNSCKCGFIDTEKLLMQMPETKTAKEQMEKETKAMRDQLEVMQVEANNKYQAYVENDKLEAGNAAKWTKIVKQDKETELQSLQQRIQEFQNTAQQSLQQKQGELYEPILKKVDDAIKKVAADGNYMVVYDINKILYVSTTLCTDITTAVKTTLGIK